MEKLRIAIHYGADAVYLGGKSFGLRNLAGNFSTTELIEAVGYAHDRQVKVYLTVNSYPDNADLPALGHFLEEAAAIPFDAYIAADPGVIEMIREVSPHRAIHLSTQANTINWRSALFWEKQGVRGSTWRAKCHWPIWVRYGKRLISNWKLSSMAPCASPIPDAASSPAS